MHGNNGNSFNRSSRTDFTKQKHYNVNNNNYKIKEALNFFP